MMIILFLCWLWPIAILYSVSELVNLKIEKQEEAGAFRIFLYILGTISIYMLIFSAEVIMQLI